MIEIFDGRLTIIGTSHISEQSVRSVREAITVRKPSVVAVELDATRLQSLLQPAAKKGPSLGMIKDIGVSGFVFLVFASWAQQQLGKVVKLTPGADMLAAVRSAKEHNISLALIDQDIRITISRLSAKLTWRERVRFVRDIVRGMFFPKAEMRRLGFEKLDLTKVPPEHLIEKMMEEFKTSYPSLYLVLVVERNEFMAKKLVRLLLREEIATIVAVVGAGHEKEIAQLVQQKYKLSEKV
jgi:pheromone shutdown-related protein TraB